ncbi:hypothetical protein GCM10023215_15350 [Pseudonocardia yuanmonensis]|uniref:Uncharacterized protein n=1 Tax=Pseudonocardia yuanmonensis TaxID=1095914 RepID=A0ABP8W6G0_9PSEU
MRDLSPLERRAAALDAREEAIRDRIAQIEGVLAELRTRLNGTGTRPVAPSELPAQRCLDDAERRRRVAALHAIEALTYAARAHRRAAERHQLCADRGGPAASMHQEKAEHHNRAARADEQHARELSIQEERHSVVHGHPTTDS